jgi:hypothetical protein
MTSGRKDEHSGASEGVTPLWQDGEEMVERTAVRHQHRLSGAGD